jgi:hypothetical protein
MMKRLIGTVLLAITVAGLCVVFPRTLVATDSNLTVHEWGTFTSIAGDDGQAVEWRPLTGPSDLPCFVTTLNSSSVKLLPNGGIPGVKARVRMETPVLYFYSPLEMTARVSVTFPQGIFSEWYPQARNTPAPLVGFEKWRGELLWPAVRISPGAKESFPTEPDDSHYYAARETDAAPVSVAGQQEKFLFYRGVANFDPRLTATVAGDGTIVVEPRGAVATGSLILFERRSGRVGYRVVHASERRTVIDRPDLTGDVESLREELRAELMAQGLYRREAAAMVETWRDSWFEEGARLFYVVARSTIDGLLPLEIDPKPGNVTRVFVGRMEVVTAEIETDVANAIRTKNQVVLRKYGRFLEPISQIIQARSTAKLDEKRMDEAMKIVSSSPHGVCNAPASRVAGSASIQ